MLFIEILIIFIIPNNNCYIQLENYILNYMGILINLIKQTEYKNEMQKKLFFLQQLKQIYLFIDLNND